MNRDKYTEDLHFVHDTEAPTGKEYRSRCASLREDFDYLQGKINEISNRKDDDSISNDLAPTQLFDLEDALKKYKALSVIWATKYPKGLLDDKQEETSMALEKLVENVLEPQTSSIIPAAMLAQDFKTVYTTNVPSVDEYFSVTSSLKTHCDDIRALFGDTCCRRDLRAFDDDTAAKYLSGITANLKVYQRLLLAWEGNKPATTCTDESVKVEEARNSVKAECSIPEIAVHNRADAISDLESDGHVQIHNQLVCSKENGDDLSNVLKSSLNGKTEKELEWRAQTKISKHLQCQGTLPLIQAASLRKHIHHSIEETPNEAEAEDACLQVLPWFIQCKITSTTCGSSQGPFEAMTVLYCSIAGPSDLSVSSTSTGPPALSSVSSISKIGQYRGQNPDVTGVTWERD